MLLMNENVIERKFYFENYLQMNNKFPNKMYAKKILPKNFVKFDSDDDDWVVVVLMNECGKML